MNDTASLRESMADVLIVEDNAGRLRTYREYLEGRGDLTPHSTSFASEATRIVESIRAQGRSVDLFVLDVRVPASPAELAARRLPESFPPRGAELAKQLFAQPETSRIPVIVYTQYADQPEVRQELQDLEENCRNVVEIFRDRLSIAEFIERGLTSIRQLDVTIEPDSDDPMRIAVVAGPECTSADLRRCGLLLNGCPPCESQLIEQAVLRIEARFDAGALFEHDVNYLLVRSEDGRKSFFPIDSQENRFDSSLYGVAQQLRVPLSTVRLWRDDLECPFLQKRPCDIAAVRQWLDDHVRAEIDPKSEVERRRLELEVKKLEREGDVFSCDKVFWLAVAAAGIGISSEIRQWIRQSRGTHETEPLRTKETNSMNGQNAPRQPMAKVLLVEDDQGMRRSFVQHAKDARGDIEPRVADDTSTFGIIIEEHGASLDLILLDIRLPDLPHEAKRLAPEERPPRGALLARDLVRNADTSRIPVVVYSRNALHPEVEPELDDLQHNWPNVVEVHRFRPGIAELLDSGLPMIREFDVNVERREYKIRLTVAPGANVTLAELEGAEYLLNGCGPNPNEVLRQKGGGGLWVCFDREALLDNFNYLLVRLPDGRKSIFRV